MQVVNAPKADVCSVFIPERSWLGDAASFDWAVRESVIRLGFVYCTVQIQLAAVYLVSSCSVKVDL